MNVLAAGAQKEGEESTKTWNPMLPTGQYLFDFSGQLELTPADLIKLREPH